MQGSPPAQRVRPRRLRVGRGTGVTLASTAGSVP